MTRKSPPIEERIWEFFDIGTTQECWEWKGRRGATGYGRIKVNGIPRTASRVVYEVTHNVSLGSLFALHHCDNPPCVNPNHLYAGTHKQNMRDSVERKRHINLYVSRKGERNGRAKLTESDIPLIRRRIARGDAISVIARDFRVAEPTIYLIKKGERWGHVETQQELICDE